MNRIINRLVEASGGWETFLYQTLKDVCEKVGDTFEVAGRGPSEIIDEAREIIEAWERFRGGRSEIKVPMVDDDQSEVPTEVLKKEVAALQTKAVEGDVEWKLEDLILTPASRPQANSRTLTGRVHVDKDIGGSSGELPLPANHRLVNRGAISITTLDGLILGTASIKDGEEGQIKGQHVTGHVSTNGNYRLAFTDTKLGAAHVNYDVVALPTKMTSKQYKEAVALANKLSVEELQERLKHFGMVYQVCLCGKADCFGWGIIDQAILEEAKAERASRMQAQRNVGVVGAGPVA